MAESTTLGGRIKAARLRRQMTVAELAGASNLTKGFISQVERGLALPSLDSLGRIAAALKVAPQTLLGDDPAAPPSGKGDTIVPIRFPATSEYDSASSLTLLQTGELSGAAFASVKLVPGASMNHARTAGQSHGFMVVLAGEAAFSSGETQYSLRSGEMLSWNASLLYRVENNGSVPLLLALMLEDGAHVPVVTDALPDYYASLQQATSKAISAEGPLRLAALRQQVRVQEGR